jgi:aminoglycoside phosphotransferase family enzyme
VNRSQVECLARSLQAEIIETNISWVLLNSRFAYKIKKPIKTTFLDFSTLKKRKKYCTQELELNQKLAPHMYLKVASINDSYFLGTKSGKIIDYAVKMKKMDGAKQMNLMLSKDLVEEKHMQSLAKVVATFHSTSSIIKSGVSSKQIIHDFMDILSMKKIIRQYFDKYLLNKFLKAAKDVNGTFPDFSSNYRNRVQDGFIREGHGDLHSGNIFLYKEPIIFDRIEFNKHFREIDVLHEVAFLCMDLEAFKQAHLSKIFLSKYLMYSGFYFGNEEEKFFNFYKCYTANVRAKVNLMRLEKAKNLKEEKEAKKEALKYLKMMLKYASKLKNG